MEGPSVLMDSDDALGPSERARLDDDEVLGDGGLDERGLLSDVDVGADMNLAASEASAGENNE